MAAQVFVAELVDQMFKIANLNLPGSPRDWVREGLRVLTYKQRCIYFRSYDDYIDIVRVVHGKQDIDTIFGQETDE